MTYPKGGFYYFEIKVNAVKVKGKKITKLPSYHKICLDCYNHLRIIK